MSTEAACTGRPWMNRPFDLYGRDACWWPAVSQPDDYSEEARFFLRLLRSEGSGGGPLRVLELGSGGGHLVSNLRDQAEFTLVDRSRPMLEQSRRLLPEFEHVQGDMTTVRLGQEFDAVLVHDACCFLTDLESLRRTVGTAAVHCRTGGVVVFAPDYVRETFLEEVEQGSGVATPGTLQYLSWVHDPDPNDCTYQVDTTYLLRQNGSDGEVRAAHERQIEGLFGREQWLRELGRQGFEARCVAFEHPEEPPEERIMVGVRRS